MRLLLAIVLLTTILNTSAQQLDVAIIQFPELKTVEELEAALASVNLADLTNADRTMSSESYLKGGYVVFVQSLPLVSRFASSTRLSNNRADVVGRLTGNSLALSITLSQGVAAGIRRFTTTTYEAQASVPPGQPRVMSLRQVNSKTASATKGRAELRNVTFSSATIAQITK